MRSVVFFLLNNLTMMRMSMDVTRAFGGIIANEATKPPLRRKSMASNRRQSTRRRSSGEASTLDDATMDLTMAIGGIQPSQDDTVSKEDEDMTMEFTSVVGGVLAHSISQLSQEEEPRWQDKINE